MRRASVGGISLYRKYSNKGAIMDKYEAAKYILDMTKRASDLAKFDGVRHTPSIGENAENLEDLYYGTRTQYLSFDDKFAIMIGNYFLSDDNYRKYYISARKVLHEKS